VRFREDRASLPLRESGRKRCERRGAFARVLDPAGGPQRLRHATT